ncbi:hypothetical protein H5410_046647 [Solanum commersonii]|uniref:MADS-box domain-containing protein n=1 Tax=Solanum commersonii TaxID=4109 RepID=A0A9J5XEW6_SOLCO|nr:hypothetical protein H5410_046647 [Solanum commersonii]
MAHRKFKNRTYLSVSDRKFILYKRVTSLFKKAQKLSNLCDVQIGITIFSSDEILLRPSETEAREKVQIKKKELRNWNKSMGTKNMELLFNEVIEGKSTHELDVEELKGLIKLCALKNAKVAE